MKVALINLPFLFPVKDEVTLSHCIGIRSLSAVLKSKGHTVYFIDALREGFKNVRKYANGYIAGLELPQIVDRIPEDTDFIGVSVAFSQISPIAHDTIELIKERYPDKVVVMGGVYPSTQTELALTSKADYIVKGEGEIALTELVEGKDPAAIKGVYACGKDLEGPFESAEVTIDLDTLPFPDYDIPEIDSYFNISPRMIRGRTASIVTSRGCPFKCEFCSIHPVCGYKWRYRSAENVIAEMHYLIEKHGINSFEFEDDNLTMNRKRVVKIFEEIIRLNEQGKNISWRTPNGVRIDTLDDELIQMMARANCKELVLALENGDAEMLEIMNKKLSLDKAYSVIKSCVEHDFSRVILFIIVGYPGETRERFESSLSFLKKVKDLGGNVEILANLAQPYPGTGLLARCWDNGYITDKNIVNFLIRRDIMTTRRVSIITPDFDAREVRKRSDEIYKLSGTLWKRRLKQILPSNIVSMVRSMRAH